VSKINKLGTGPGEYGILADFDISENDELIILDAQKILICDMQGHLKNSIPLHLTGFNIQRLKNERYLVCASGEKYVLYVLDKNGHVLKKELKNKLSTRIGSDVPFVSVSPEKIIFQTGFSNDFVLYDMDENVFSDIRFLCNNECINTREEDRLMEIYGLDYLEKSPDLKILFGMASYKNHLLYKSGNGKKYTIHFTNIIHHAEDRVSSATLDDITYSTTPDLLLDYVHYGNAEDCFISYFYPSQLNIGHHDNEYNDKYRELIRSLTTGTIDLDDENPILFEFTVRNCPPGAAAEVKPDGAKGALIIEDLIAAILTLMIVVRFGKEASLPVSVYD
jgi:hypothetical protein